MKDERWHNKNGILKGNSLKVLKVLMENCSGLEIKTIMKLTNLRRRTAYNALSRLKKERIIENISPIWKLCQNQVYPLKLALRKNSYQIQVHNISFILQIIRKPFWWDKRKNMLTKIRGYNKEVIWSNNSYQKIDSDNFFIHTFKNSIIFISKKKYYGNNPYNCFIESLDDFLNELISFEKKIKFIFFLEEIPQVSVKSSHFVKLKDAIARRCKKKGDRFEVYIDKELRALVDFSEPLGMEFVNKDYNLEDTARYSYYVEDIIKTNPMKPSEMQEEINDSKKILKELSKNQLDTIMVMKQIDFNIKYLVKIVGDKKDL